MAGSGELFKNDDGTWSFRVRAAGGEVVATDASGGRASKDDAKAVLQQLLRGDYNGPVVEVPTLVCGQEITEDTTLDGDLVCPSGPALIVTANNVTLDLNGFSISGDPSSPGGGPGILLRSVTGVTVRKGTVQHFGAGVAINGGSGNKVLNMTVQDNVGPADGDYGDGIVLTESSENLIQGNTVRRNGPFSGISLVGASQRNQILENSVMDNNMLQAGNPGAGRQTMGIRVEGPAANDNKIVGNMVHASGADGIVVLPTCVNFDTEPQCVGTPPNENNEITHNACHHNGTSGRGDGIRLFSVPNPVAPAHTTIADNVADNNVSHGIGIDAAGSHNPGPTQNRVTGNSAHGNGEFDGFDGNMNPRCGTNTWQGNDFGTVNQPCVSSPAPNPPGPPGPPTPPPPPPPPPMP